MIAANSVSSGVSCVPPPCGRAFDGGFSGSAISHSPSGTIQLHVPRPMTSPTSQHHVGHGLRRHLIWFGRLSVVVSIVERLVPDELWELFQRVVPEAPSRPQGGGRRRHGDREVLAAIVFVATSGCTWQQLPSASFGPSGATAHRRFAEWSKARVWARLHRLVLDELGSRGELDWSRCAIDSVNMRALKRGI
jgi:transposase